MSLATAVLFGIGTALPLLLGAIIGLFWSLLRRVIAGFLAFASGSLITALAFDLFVPAVRAAGFSLTVVSFLAGTGAFVLAEYGIGIEKRESGEGLLIGVIADGIPENLTLGVALIGAQPSGEIAILIDNVHSMNISP